MARWKMYDTENTVKEAWSLAYGEIESLHSEIEEWESNMSQSEGLSATAKYEEVNECLDQINEAFNYLDEVGDDVFTSEDTITYKEYRRKRYPRWRRMNESVFILDSLIEWLEKQTIQGDKYEPDGAKRKERILSDLDEVKNIAENIMWPSMF